MLTTVVVRLVDEYGLSISKPIKVYVRNEGADEGADEGSPGVPAAKTPGLTGRDTPALDKRGASAALGGAFGD